MLKLYENIKKRRSELKMTQDELAKKCGYKDRSMIALIERGDIDLPQSKIFAVADALRTTPSALMGMDGTTEQIFLERISVYVEKLNDEGLKKAEEYLADLADMEKYTKK